MDIAAADKYITGVYLYYLTVGEYLLYLLLCSEVILCILAAESGHYHCLIAYIKIYIACAERAYGISCRLAVKQVKTCDFFLSHIYRLRHSELYNVYLSAECVCAVFKHVKAGTAHLVLFARFILAPR